MDDQPDLTASIPIVRRQVVYVWPYLEWGGAQVYLLGLMKVARPAYDLKAVMPAGTTVALRGYLNAIGVPQTLMDARFDVSPVVGLRGRLRRRLGKLQVELAMGRVLRREPPGQTLFHCDLAPWTFCGLLAYLAWRSRVVVTLHTALPVLSWPRRLSWRAKFWLLSSLRGFSLIAANRDVRSSLRPYLGRGALARIPVSYSPVDSAEIADALAPVVDRAAELRRLGIPQDRFVVVTLGQFIERKGCWVWLEAIARLRSSMPDLAVVWLAPQAMPEADARRIAASGMSEVFHYRTPLDFGPSRRDLLRTMSAADLFVLPSLEEGLPLALLEAMALGLPCVATTINAVPEAIASEEHGLLVQPGDARVLADAVTRLHGDAALRRRLADAGRRRVLAEFELQTTARPTLEVYDAAFGNGDQRS